MDSSLFVRPNKPFVTKKPVVDIKVPNLAGLTDNRPKMLTVDSSTECHVTPDIVAEFMAGALQVSGDGEMSVYEPHGGTGQLVNALLDKGVCPKQITTSEKHYSLVEFMGNRFEGVPVKIVQGDVFELSLGKFDRILCNPPFKRIVAHLDHLYGLLKDDGIMVALVPVTYSKIDHVELDVLPDNTFSWCKVRTKIIRIER